MRGSSRLEEAQSALIKIISLDRNLKGFPVCFSFLKWNFELRLRGRLLQPEFSSIRNFFEGSALAVGGRLRQSAWLSAEKSHKVSVGCHHIEDFSKDEGEDVQKRTCVQGWVWYASVFLKS